MFAVKGRSLSSLTQTGDAPQVAAAASNLTAFRQLFTSDDRELDTHHGFKKSDELVKSCVQIQNQILDEIKLLQKQIRNSKLLRIKKEAGEDASGFDDSAENAESRGGSAVDVTFPSTSKGPAKHDGESGGELIKPKRPVGRPPKRRPSDATVTVSSTKEHAENLEDSKDDFKGFSPESQLRKKCQQRLDEINTELGECGRFMGFPDNDPLHLACIQHLEAIKNEVKEVANFQGFEEDDELRIKCLQSYKNVTDEISQVLKMMANANSVKPLAVADGKQSQEDSCTCAPSIDTKSVNHPSQQQIYSSDMLDDVLSKKKLAFDNCVTGSLNSNQNSLHEPYSADIPANELMYGSHEESSTVPATLIKSFLPCSLQHINTDGFPVVVTAQVPPKPLCFLCGSAGIDQV